ncbi:MAG: 30S ribosome-binding factor RbfA [Oscillospiraceae bacterium]|nr:30S ribosome-binding factor RbfA [Oscillospiraceae bacterium]
MANQTRIAKINDEIRRELGALIPRLKDPRVRGLISVTRVDTARDMSLAKVYISVLPGTADGGEVIKGLVAASGFLRHELGQSLKLRLSPEIKFFLDDSISHGAHIIDVLNTIRHAEGDQNDSDAE